jgi:hypothetical protein
MPFLPLGVTALLLASLSDRQSMSAWRQAGRRSTSKPGRTPTGWGMMRVLMRERVGKSGGSTAGIADVHKPRTLAKLHGLENADDLEQCLQARPPWAYQRTGVGMS